MEGLLAPLIALKKDAGINIEFHPVVKGDPKTTLLTHIPVRAVEILYAEPETIVIVLPDLYPPNKGCPHHTVEEMVQGAMAQFRAAIKQQHINAQRLLGRFKVFCFKYELEALLLANEDVLKLHLNTKALNRTWILPVEDQNHDHPPKQVVSKLFHKHRRSYSETLDAPRILRQCNYLETADRCPQCFKPFVEFLAAL